MSNVKQFPNKRLEYLARLVLTGKYDLDELETMTLVQLRETMDKEFPITVKETYVMPSGGVSRRTKVVKRVA